MTSQYLEMPKRPWAQVVGESFAHQASRLKIGAPEWEKINRDLALCLPAVRLAFSAKLQALRGMK